MVSKSQLLRLIDFDFLDTFLLNFNNKPRHHSFDSKETLIKFYAKKFNKTQVREIFDSFKIGLSPVDVANNMKELNGYKLGFKFIELSKPKYYSFEVRLGKNKCDLVLLDENFNLTAIEIKANNDYLQRALKQCEMYSKWADYVYVLTELNKSKLLDKVMPTKFGRILYNKHTNKFFITKADKTKNPNTTLILRNLSKEKLKILAKKYKIKATGNKSDLLNRFEKFLDNKYFINDVKMVLLK